MLPLIGVQGGSSFWGLQAHLGHAQIQGRIHHQSQIDGVNRLAAGKIRSSAPDEPTGNGAARL